MDEGRCPCCKSPVYNSCPSTAQQQQCRPKACPRCSCDCGKCSCNITPAGPTPRDVYGSMHFPPGSRPPSPHKSVSPPNARSPSPPRPGSPGGSPSPGSPERPRTNKENKNDGRKGGGTLCGDMVVCFGELLIDFVPTVGGLSLAGAPAFKKAPGGAPANVACGVAKLGGGAAFFGKVGDDEFGYMLVDVLKDNYVETRAIRFDPNARTALAFVTLREGGEREFMFYRNPSADMLFEKSDLDIELIEHAKIMHYGSISLITEPSRSAHLEALRIAKKAGVMLSYDPNLRLPLWPSPEAAKQGIKSIWDLADLIKVSDEEVQFLTDGGDASNDAVNLTLWHPRLKLLLVTEGPNGCRYYTEKFKGTVPGVKVKPIDTTGAGDAFCAGYLSQLLEDMNLFDNEQKLRDALLFANACGAITTTERGAIPALPDKETVLKILGLETPRLAPADADVSWKGYTRWQSRKSSLMIPQTMNNYA